MILGIMGTPGAFKTAYVVPRTDCKISSSRKGNLH